MKPTMEKLTAEEIVEQMKARLSEARQLAANLCELERLVPFGSPIHRGLKMIQRDVDNAEQNLQRLCTVARNRTG